MKLFSFFCLLFVILGLTDVVKANNGGLSDLKVVQKRGFFWDQWFSPPKVMP